MLEGSYGETILLGSGARGSVTSTLPTLKNGKEPVAQARINTMMQRLYGYMYAMGVRIDPLNVQVPLVAKYKNNVWLSGELDLFPVIVNDIVSVIDIKTTKDIHNTFFTIDEEKVKSCSSGCWGSYNKIAKNQPLFYHHLVRNFKSATLEGLIRYRPDKEQTYRRLFTQEIQSDTMFYFFIAGIGSPKIYDQLVHYGYEYTTMREKLLETLVESAVARVSQITKEGFKPNKKDHLCNSCALKNICC